MLPRLHPDPHQPVPRLPRRSARLNGDREEEDAFVPGARRGIVVAEVVDELLDADGVGIGRAPPEDLPRRRARRVHVDGEGREGVEVPPRMNCLLARGPLRELDRDLGLTRLNVTLTLSYLRESSSPFIGRDASTG